MRLFRCADSRSRSLGVLCAALLSHPPLRVLQSPAIAGLAAAQTGGRAPALARPQMKFIPVCDDGDVEEGKKAKVVTKRSIKVVVAKKEGKTYAFNNKCPHLGLSLKRGQITGSDDRHGVCVVCPYHKSKFSLEDGKCKVWSESILGIKGTEGIGEKIGNIIPPMAKSVNPELKKAAPVQVFETKTEDGQVYVDLPPDLSKYAKTRKYIDYGVYEDLPADTPRRPVDPRG